MDRADDKHNDRTPRCIAAAAVPCLLVALGGCGEREPTASTAQLAAEMSERIEAIMRAETIDGLVPRFNQAKSIGCVAAEFRVHADIPQALQQGLFARPGRYPAYLRFASASETDDAEKDLRGLSIRVANVDGAVAWGQPGLQDFLLNSHPALFVATPEDFLAFIRARQADKKLGFFLNPLDPHLKSLWILFKARKRHLSPLDIRYWSTVPFALGESGGLAVKYSATPCSDYRTARAVDPGENQLRAALRAHLRQAPACFHFAVQRRGDPADMPIEDASVVWDEERAPFQTVATLTIEDQDFDTPAALARCERSRFNPWQGLTAHRPLGRMNEVRREVYARAAELRNRP